MVSDRVFAVKGSSDSVKVETTLLLQLTATPTATGYGYRNLAAEFSVF